MAREDTSIRIPQNIRDEFTEQAKKVNKTLKEYLQDSAIFFKKNDLTPYDIVDVSIPNLIENLKTEHEKTIDRIFKFLKTEEKNYFLPQQQTLKKIEAYVDFLASHKHYEDKNKEQIEEHKQEEIEVKTSENFSVLHEKIEKLELINSQVKDILLQEILRKGTIMNGSFIINLSVKRKEEIIEFLSKIK